MSRGGGSFARATDADREERHVRVRAGDAELDGDLVLARRARGCVLFAHGSGSGRRSPRNRYVASVLRASGLSTLLVDLLTREEEAEDAATRALRFDIGLLSRRLVGCVDWLAGERATSRLGVGLYGSSTGAAAALVAAAERPERVHAVVSRGGRTDLTGEALERVRAPTLLLVGSRDEPVLEINRESFERLHVAKELVVVPGASHLFEEPGAMDRVAHAAADWFSRHLAAPER